MTDERSEIPGKLNWGAQPSEDDLEETLRRNLNQHKQEQLLAQKAHELDEMLSEAAASSTLAGRVRSMLSPSLPTGLKLFLDKEFDQVAFMEQEIIPFLFDCTEKLEAQRRSDQESSQEYRGRFESIMASIRAQ